MQELIWFLLGVAVCSLFVRLTILVHKVYLLSQFKYHAFQLIYYSYKQLVYTTASKYIFLENSPDVNKEELKILRNDDAAFISEWKKGVASALKTKLPSYLQPALRYDNWDEIVNQLSREFVNVVDKDFKKELEKIEKTN
jgi:hypothetical protein